MSETFVDGQKLSSAVDLDGLRFLSAERGAMDHAYRFCRISRRQGRKAASYGPAKKLEQVEPPTPPVGRVRSLLPR